MVEYYLAEKSCSMSVEERLLLSADEKGNVKIHRGESTDRFSMYEDGKPICTTWDGITIPYSIIGPLTEEQVKEWLSLNEIYFSRKLRRVHSVI